MEAHGSIPCTATTWARCQRQAVCFASKTYGFDSHCVHQNKFCDIKNIISFALWFYVNIRGSFRLPLVAAVHVYGWCPDIKYILVLTPLQKSGVFYCGVGKSGFSRLLWEQDCAGSNPVTATGTKLFWTPVKVTVRRSALFIRIGSVMVAQQLPNLRVRVRVLSCAQRTDSLCWLSGRSAKPIYTGSIPVPFSNGAVTKLVNVNDWKSFYSGSIPGCTTDAAKAFNGWCSAL